MKRWEDKQKEKFLQKCFVDKKFGLGLIEKPDSNHRLVTRRDFLAHAVNAGISYIALPSIATLMAQKVYAAEDCSSITAQGAKLKVLQIDCEGGTPFATQFAVGGEGGVDNYLSPAQAGANPYRRLFMTPNSSYLNAGVAAAVNKEFGVHFHPGSTFLESMLANIPAGQRQFIDGVNFPMMSRSDQPTNKMAFIRALGYFGFNGSLAAATGTEAGTGGRHDLMRGMPASAPNVSIVADVTQARSLAGSSALQLYWGNNAVSKQAAERTLKAIKNMSESARRDFSNLTPDKQAELVVKCGLIDHVTRPARFEPDNIISTNPFNDTVLSLAFGGNFNNLTNPERQAAIMSRLLFEGYSAAGNVVVGGCDNHANAQPNAPFTKQQEIGRIVARSMRYFMERNAALPADQQQSLLIVLTTDGSMEGTNRAFNGNANGTNLDYVGADGDTDHSHQVAMIYSPQIVKSGAAGTNQVSNLFRDNTAVRQTAGGPAKRQLGWYTPDGTIADQSSVFTNDPSNWAVVMVMNILALYGRESEYTALTGGRNLFRNTADQEKHTVFAKLF